MLTARPRFDCAHLFQGELPATQELGHRKNLLVATSPPRYLRRVRGNQVSGVSSLLPLSRNRLRCARSNPSSTWSRLDTTRVARVWRLSDPVSRFTDPVSRCTRENLLSWGAASRRPRTNGKGSASND